MRFSRDYPYAPPSFKFDTRDIHHPNVYPDGRVCISILHTPGDDEQSGEEASERWSPLQGVESVLRSVLLLLDEPETNSPANVDASVLYRSDRAKYDARARETARSSRVQKPDDVHFPSQAELEPTPVKVPEDDSFWNESEPEDFSDSEFAYEDEDDDEEQEGDESG
jgi:ubiquitin-conjugating enzyme E2 R